MASGRGGRKVGYEVPPGRQSLLFVFSIHTVIGRDKRVRLFRASREDAMPCSASSLRILKSSCSYISLMAG